MLYRTAVVLAAAVGISAASMASAAAAMSNRDAGDRAADHVVHRHITRGHVVKRPSALVRAASGVGYDADDPWIYNPGYAWLGDGLGYRRGDGGPYTAPSYTLSPSCGFGPVGGPCVAPQD